MTSGHIVTPPIDMEEDVDDDEDESTERLDEGKEEKNRNDNTPIHME